MNNCKYLFECNFMYLSDFLVFFLMSFYKIYYNYDLIKIILYYYIKLKLVS